MSLRSRPPSSVGISFCSSRRHDDPLPLLAVAGHVLLDRLRVPVLAVALQHVARLVEALDVVLRKHAGPGAEDARADHLAGLDQVAVRKHVGRRRLRIARRRHAVGEVRQVLPDLRLVDVPCRPDVRVDVDQARHDRLAGDVDRSRAGRHRDLAARPDGHDAVVPDDDVAVVDDLGAFHRDDARAAQHDSAGRLRARGLDDDLGRVRLRTPASFAASGRRLSFSASRFFAAPPSWRASAFRLVLGGLAGREVVAEEGPAERKVTVLPSRPRRGTRRPPWSVSGPARPRCRGLASATVGASPPFTGTVIR